MDPAAREGLGQRVIVVGSSSSGKSTLAARLAAHLGVPLIELDALYWEPGWVPAEREVFRERVRQAIAAPAWVMAGNYTRQQQDVSWPAADTIVWLDLELPTLLLRCLRRSWRRWRRQELLWGTNRERFWVHLKLWDPDASLLAYTLRTYRRRRRELEAAGRDPRWAHLTIVRLRSAREVDRWLAEVLAAPAPATTLSTTIPR